MADKTFVDILRERSENQGDKIQRNQGDFKIGKEYKALIYK